MNLARISQPLAIAVLLLLGGCAVGNTVDFQAPNPTLTADSDRDVVVTVLDQRTYVVSGEKDPTFVGLRRAGFGNPWDVKTRSGTAFTDEMTSAIVDALVAADIPARSIAVPPSSNPASAIDAAIGVGADRSLVVFVNEWKSDAYFNLELDYDLTVQILDAAGTLLARNDVSGNDNLGPVTFESDYWKAAGEAFDRIIEELLNHPDILAALE